MKSQTTNRIASTIERVRFFATRTAKRVDEELWCRRYGGRIISASPRVSTPSRVGQVVRRTPLILVFAVLSFLTPRFLAGQAQTIAKLAVLPDAPEPQTPAASPSAKKQPCPRKVIDGSTPANPDPLPVGPATDSAPCKMTWASRYQLFANGPQDKPLTPKDKAWLAARNVADPFNNITILGEAAIAVGADSHSPYGPGMAGYGRYVGVSYTQDLIGEFFGTYAIPSIVHQDPHYHRMPKSGIPRRIFHATWQVVWTQGDDGRGMLNYSNLVGFAIDDGISNLYVPGRETTASASASRYAIGMATAPIGNYITEFVPDLARHIHVQIVVIQRIINQVARSEGGQP